MVEFKQQILENGLTILHERRDVSVTTVMLGTKYGARYELEKEKGIAHFIEHLCFKGTKKRNTKEIADEIEGIGGVLNAFTSEEVTAYFAKIPSDHLEKVIEVLSDIFYNPIFPEEEVKKESQVICEEIKMYNDNPMAHVVHGLSQRLYEKPFGMSIAGTEENVKNMTREQLLSKHRKIYSPKNSVLIVVGNNSFEEVLEFANKFSVEREFDEIVKPEIKMKIETLEEKRSNLQQANLAIGFHFPFEDEKDEYVAQIFSDILGGGMSSRLFTEVREKRGLVYGVKSDVDSGKDYSYFMIWAGTDPSKVEEVKSVCLEEFSKMKDLTKEELALAKVKVLGSHNVALEGSDEVARELLCSWANGNAEEFYSFEEKINSVKLEDVRKLAEKKDYSFFSLGP